MAFVSIIKTDDYNHIKQCLVDVISPLGNINSFVAKDDNVLIKPNLLGPQRYHNDPLITDPSLILACAQLIHDLGAKVSIADSPAWGTPLQILSKTKVFKDLQKLNVNIINLNKPKHKFKIFAKDYSLKNYKIINLPKLKVHCQLGLSLAVKNMFGCIAGKRKAILHFSLADRHNLFAEMLVKNCFELNPVLNILDAVYAMDKKGPMGGVPKLTNLLFASTDPVALDAVITHALQYPIPYKILTAAKSLNLGQFDISQINTNIHIPKISLVYPNPMPISFSPIKISKSLIKNIFIKHSKHTTKTA